VATRIATKNGTEVPIEYRLLKKGDRWLVYDLNIEGVSLVSNYRTQFNKIIQTGSFTDLIQKLKAKQGDLSADDQSKGKDVTPVKR
jgi:phospholipid transport system substrate-binding protein